MSSAKNSKNNQSLAYIPSAVVVVESASSSASSSGSSSKTTSTQPLISPASSRPFSSQRRQSTSRSPSPTTVKVTTTTNSEDKPSPDHKRLIQFLLHQKQRHRQPRSKSPSPLITEGVSARRESREKAGSWISPPPMPQQYQMKNNCLPSQNNTIRKRRILLEAAPSGPESLPEPNNSSELSESEQQLLQQQIVRTSPLYTTDRKMNRMARMRGGSLDYHSWKEISLDFCARTSSHGIPFVGTHSFFGRLIWLSITLFAFSAFCIQTYYTLSDYLSYRTIIEIQLKFEPAPFPAATLCNLNSFKFSELRKFDEIELGFKLWERAISTLDEQLLIVKEEERALLTAKLRKRRQVKYQPVYVKCVCSLPDDQCVPQRNDLDVNASICLCFEDARTGDIWPCYSRSVWKEKKCFHCSLSNTCDDPDKPPNVTTLLTEPRERDCLCQSVSHYCLVRNLGEEIKWWNPHNYSVFPATEAPALPSEVEEAFGLEDLRDRGAITTKTKENLIFLVAAMPRETRQQLSYNLDEFVLRCSFNSKDCDLKRDFQIQIDPEYGNCFTFNFNDSVELKNSRAGPMYGLRLLLNVNQSDYMPTTEAAGVRLVVHEQDQEPFPDTFGYSAPTGFISSFGLKAKVIDRLDSYGKCSDTFRPENYIYAEHYSPEGCYRNCFQQIIVQRCGCGDPRFPLPILKDIDVRPCDARNHAERSCLANETSVLGGFHHLTHDCECIQPCKENVFETAYSAAAWPAINFNIGADCATVLETENFTQEACAEYYRQNTAYIEIYYEQLNFESLKETPGYTMVNLFSDLGGNIGLWIGFSLITVLEFVELICECITFGCEKCVFHRLKRRQRHAKTMNALVGAAYLKKQNPTFADDEEKLRRPRKSPPPVLAVEKRDEKGSTAVYYYEKGSDNNAHLDPAPKQRTASLKQRTTYGNADHFGAHIYYAGKDMDGEFADAVFNNASNRKNARVVRMSPRSSNRTPTLVQEWKKSEDV